MKKTLLIGMLIFTIISHGQNKQTSINAITKTVQNYYDGYIERDINKLNAAFDILNGTMKIPILENEKIIGFKNHYFKDLMPKWGNRIKLSKEVLQNCALEILNIDVVDNTIASVKMSMKVDTITYIDILSLQKIKNSWKITNKIFTIK